VTYFVDCLKPQRCIEQLCIYSW